MYDPGLAGFQPFSGRYCMKYFLGRIRKTLGITMTTYETILSADEGHQHQHRSAITVMIQLCIKAGSMGTHLDWEALDVEALKVVRIQKTTVYLGAGH